MRNLVAAVALTLAATAASAQAWPAKPVTLLVPFPPGGSTDMIARTVQPKLTEKFGGTFIVENKGGAGGTIGAAQVKRAAPDGYTILVSSLGPFVIGPHLIKGAGYDPTKDFDYITVAVQAPNVLTVPANSPHKSLADVMKFLNANPDKMTFASAGNGTSDHLTAELFWQETNTKGVHVPYKGGAPAISDLLGGQVDASFQNINAVFQRPYSVFWKAAKASGELPTTSNPTSSSLGLTCGSLSASTVAACSFALMSAGRPLGAAMACHEVTVTPL